MNHFHCSASVERERRNKINSWISELGKLIVEEEDSPALSKIQILERACQYVEEVNSRNLQIKHELRQALSENRILTEENEKLKRELKKKVA